MFIVVGGHPRNHDAQPSADDVVQLVYLALDMSADGVPAVQLIVGEADVNISHVQLISAAR